MVKNIDISGVSCRFKSSAAIPRMYRLKFGRDIFVDMNRLVKQVKANENNKEEGSNLPIDSLEMFENIAFLMHKHGDPSQPSDIEEWLEQFAMLDIYKILPEIVEMWNVENEQTSTGKKKTER